MTDIVNHPKHYREASIIVEPYVLSIALPHPVASAFEYCLRAGLKDGQKEIDEYSKARFWLLKFKDELNACRLSDLGNYPNKPDPTATMLLQLFAEKNNFAKVLFNGLTRPPFGNDRLGCIITWAHATKECIEYLDKTINDLSKNTKAD